MVYFVTTNKSELFIFAPNRRFELLTRLIILLYIKLVYDILKMRMNQHWVKIKPFQPNRKSNYILCRFLYTLVHICFCPHLKVNYLVLTVWVSFRQHNHRSPNVKYITSQTLNIPCDKDSIKTLVDFIANVLENGLAISEGLEPPTCSLRNNSPSWERDQRWYY